MITRRLYYPKENFTKKEVLTERNKLAFTKKWKLIDTHKDWILEFHDNIKKSNPLSKTKKGFIVNGSSSSLTNSSIPSKKRDEDLYNESGLMRMEVSKENV